MRHRSKQVQAPLAQLRSFSDWYLWERHEPRITPAMGYIVSVMFFHKDGFGIKSHTKVDMPLNKEINLLEEICFILSMTAKHFFHVGCITCFLMWTAIVNQESNHLLFSNLGFIWHIILVYLFMAHGVTKFSPF